MSVIQAPSRLTGAARTEWDRVTSFVEIDPADTESLAIYCETLASYLDMVEELNGQERTLPIGNNGARQVNPLVAMIRDEKNLLLKYGRRFGLDPESRGIKRKVQAQLDEDEMSKLIAGSDE